MLTTQLVICSHVIHIVEQCKLCYQQILLWLTCLIHPTVDMNKYQQDKIPTLNAIKNTCMNDVLHKEDDFTQISQV